MFLWEAGSEIDRSVNAVNVMAVSNTSVTPFLPGLGGNGTA